LPNLHAEAGIVGCGLIGVSWAGLFLASGRNVHAWDPSSAAREVFTAKAKSILAELQALKLFPLERPGTVNVYETVADVARRASFIQESAPEQAALKRQLYRDIENVATTHPIIASSTSSFAWPEIFSDTRHPDRCITAHPFNPPHLVPLVEIYGPSATVVADAAQIYRSMGRVPVCLKKPAVGHIANRLASALWREAVNMVAEDIADVASIDAALVHGPGLRWSTVGAHMAYHLGGGPGGIEHYLKHLGPSQERRWSTLGNPRLTPEVCQMIIAGIAREAAGRTISELEAERDRNLVAVLKARQFGETPGREE
jgi:carnitine 3-dehydrogenase